MIRFADLSKRYGTTQALDGLTLTIPDGAIFGLLGPNGAGKSTLIKLLMGFIFPDRGTIDRGGLTPQAIGYLPERPFFPARCPVGEYMLTVGALGGAHGAALRERVASCLEQVGLSHAARWPINACSKGMLQRLALGQALLADPAVLILDEPMGGLDPLWQKTLRELMVALHQRGKTLLFSTHRLSDVAAVATHVALLRGGRLLRAGALETVLPTRPQVTIEVAGLDGTLAAAMRALHTGVLVEGQQVVLAGEAVALRQEVVRRLVLAGVDLLELRQARVTLEELYVEAMAE